jgi:hypothetical protein
MKQKLTSCKKMKRIFYLADKFDNVVLRKLFKTFTQDSIRRYSWNFEILLIVSLNISQSFTFVVSKIIFRTNLIYLSCISKLIFNILIKQPNLFTFQIEIRHEKENEVINCISSFLNFISEAYF